VTENKHLIKLNRKQTSHETKYNTVQVLGGQRRPIRVLVELRIKQSNGEEYR
jgi:hypothetical protein